MSSTTSYNISETALARASQRSKILLALLPVIFLFMVIGILSASARGIQTSVGWALLGTLILLEGLLFAISTFVRRTMEGLSISVSDKGIKRRSDGRVELIQFAEIQKVNVTYDSEMKVTGMQVARSRGLGWTLNGFENLDGLAVALKEAVGTERIRRSTQAFDLKDVVALQQCWLSAWRPAYFSSDWDGIFLRSYLRCFSEFTGCTVVYRPYTRTLGPRLVWFEMVGGAFLIASAIWRTLLS